MYAYWSKRITSGGVRHLAKSPLHKRITFHDLRHSYATGALKCRRQSSGGQ
jgi:integrase